MSGQEAEETLVSIELLGDKVREWEVMGVILR